jgi:hypothetical protein
MPNPQNIMEEEFDDNDKTDYLEVDNPVPGQSYGCISFISPEKEIAQKNDFYSYNFYKYQLKMLKKVLGYYLRNLKKKEKVELSDLEKLESRLLDDMDQMDLTNLVNRYLYEELKESGKTASDLEEDKVDYENFTEFTEKYLDEFENYKVVNDDRIQSEYDKVVDFKTNIRGVKLRGNYETYKEAKLRAKLLQRKDPKFHVWVAQVGYWVPFDADPDKAPSSEYQEEKLQELAKKKKENEEKREMLQERRREEEKKLANLRNETLKAEQNKTRDELVKQLETEANKNKLIEYAKEPDVDTLPLIEPTETLTTNKIEQLLAQRKHQSNENEQVVQQNSSQKQINEAVEQIGFGGMDPWMARKMEEQATYALRNDDDNNE